MSFECQKCEDNFCCNYLGERTCSESCRRQNCFCVSCQLYNIEEKSPAVICQHCRFLSECYASKYLGKINGRASYILQRHCIDHCQLENCPHRDEATVELNRLILAPDYSHLISNGNPQAQADMEEQRIGTQWVSCRKASVASGEGNPVMGMRVPEADRASLAGIPADEGNRVPRRGRAMPRGVGNARCQFQLSAKTMVETRAASHPYNTSLQQ